MPSLRSWLTTRYALLLLGSMAVFVLGIFVARRTAAFREATELAQDRARLAQLILRRTSDAGAPITVRERRDQPVPEPGFQRRPQLEPRVRDMLNEVGGFVWVLADTVVYESPAVRLLDSSTVHEVNDSLKVMREAARSSVRVRLSGEGVLVERQETLPNGQHLRVVAGVPLSDVSLPPLELLGSMLIVLPLILALSVVGAYNISIRATEPLEQMTRDVAAIRDGRSLHRRLQTEPGHPELDRLTVQLNEMIARLEASFIALRRFTADASHELKTPLAVMRADVERAMHARPGGTEQLIALEEALQETTRMADLVESLLTLARADEGRLDMLRESIELEPLARDVFETALILGEDAGLVVTMPRADPCLVEGDATRLRQLCLNLVTNAIKYTPRGGEVELSLVASETEALFSVRDTGIGIAAIDLPHIFDRFYRADRVRSRQGGRGGFGLGLSISQWIAQAHGGTLSVQSRLHRGSTFTVALPLAGHGSMEAERLERRSPQPAATD